MPTFWSVLKAFKIPLTPEIWSSFVRMMGELGRSDVGPRAKRLGAFLIAFLFAISGLNVLNSYVNRDFMTAIEQKDMHGFVFYALLYVFVMGVSTVVAVLYRYSEESLGLLWRRWLTEYEVKGYLKDRIYFRMQVNGDLPNPDQRISEDLRTLTATTLSFALLFLNASITVVAFAGVLWSISPLLFAVGVSYSLFGTLLTIYLGKPLIRLNYDQLDREAKFRARLVHVRENAESIALLRREGRLRARLIARLEALVSNYQRIVEVNRNLGYFTTGYNYLIQIIPALIIAPVFIRGGTDFGVITQSAVAFGHLLGAFSLIVTQFQSISTYTAVVARLAALRDAMSRKPPERSPAVEVAESVGSVAFEHLTLLGARDDRVLVKDLSLSVPAGVCVLVRAANEASERALFRATAALWYNGAGRILHPGHDEIFFLPERPYLPPGTLREILLHAGVDERVSDQQILDRLRSLNLQGVLDRSGGLDTEQSWGEILSLGEQQRLSFARVLLASPRFVFMDHPSRGMSECPMGDLLNVLKLNEITYLTLGDEADEPNFYDRVLEIADDGSWQVSFPRRGEALDRGLSPPSEQVLEANHQAPPVIVS